MNILDKFGFKEVCDVCLYNIEETTGNPTSPVLYLDTLKISTIETNCQQVDAVGGYGNNVLLTWDYGKDISVNFTDALFSMKSLSVLNGEAVVESEDGIVRQGIQFTGTTIPSTFIGPNGKKYFIPNDYIIYNEFGEIETISDLQPNQKYVMCFSLNARQLQGISINSNNYPGVYYLIGDTVVRNYNDNVDQFCRIVIPKVKIYSEFNFELSGFDPAVFSFRARALATSEKWMMSLIKYDVDSIEPGPGPGPGPGPQPTDVYLMDVQNSILYSILDERLLARID